MTTREALEELAGRGVCLTPWELRGMLARKELPRPRLDSALKFDWTDADLRNVESALASRGKRNAET